jgi:DNA-binding NtrC family response regulator
MTTTDRTRRTLTGPQQRTLLQQRVRLEVTAGIDAGAHHEFNGVARVGSRRFADFVLGDAKVSGLHCEISSDDLRVRDLGSKNGTFLDGARIMDAMLRAGSTIRLGDTRIRMVTLTEDAELPLSSADRFHGLVATSTVMRSLIAQLERLAVADTTVLVGGETGTGKERVAEALHLGGPRASGPFIVVDCGALPPNLIESTLFGHERGAFTGANASVAGAFEQAHGGTLFLDEVGELPLELQPKLLRALESRRIHRVGGSHPVSVNIRVVAASNRDLGLEVVGGRFREDLYYRLAVVQLRVPPLRERLDDLPQLAIELLEELGADPASYLTAGSLATLSSHTWPGNVRELRNTLERAVALTQPPEIDGDDADAAVTLGPPRIDLRVPLRVGKLRLAEAYERAYLQALLMECNHNVSEAARRAGMDRMSIHRMMARLRLPPHKGKPT